MLVKTSRNDKSDAYLRFCLELMEKKEKFKKNFLPLFGWKIKREENKNIKFSE